MTPTQLRSYATVVRCGSVSAAAVELGVSQAAVSGNVGALRREFDDRLFRPSAHGLVYTPGGQRLAHRAAEILGLHDLTVREIASAHDGRRLLRVAATSLFAEYAAPGLIELFSTRADDLDVELVVDSSDRFHEMLLNHAVDVAIGPRASSVSPDLTATPFLRYDLIAVAHADVAADSDKRAWFLGPSAVEPAGVSQFILSRAAVPENQQRIYSSHAAAVDEARIGRGIALVPSFVVAESLADGSLVQLDGAHARASGTWTTFTLAKGAIAVAHELVNFVGSPRAIQAMLGGSGSKPRRFKPRVHITLWS